MSDAPKFTEALVELQDRIGAVVDHEEAQGRRVEHQLQQRFIPAQLARRLLFRGDIPVGAEHAQRPAGGIPLHDGQSADGMRAAVRPDDTELSIEMLFSTQRPPDFLVSPLLIGGVDSIQPVIVSAVG